MERSFFTGWQVDVATLLVLYKNYGIPEKSQEIAVLDSPALAFKEASRPGLPLLLTIIKSRLGLISRVLFTGCWLCVDAELAIGQCRLRPCTEPVV